MLRTILAPDGLHTSTNDDVLQSSTILKDENRIGITTLSLTRALDTTAVGLVTSVEGAADGLSLLQSDRALGAGDRKRSTLGQAEELVRSLLGRSGSNGGHEGSNSGDDSELHFFKC